MPFHRTEGAKLDIAKLGAVTELCINTVRKADLKNLVGLHQLPLEHLELRWLSAPDLRDMPFPPSLISLRIWHSSKLKSLDGIGELPNLKTLELRENGQPLDISAISQLENLEELSIEGGYGAGQRIVSLFPLQNMKITTLVLSAIDGKELDLEPVARMSSLRTADIAPLNFEHVELAKVAAAKPWFFEALMDLETAKDGFAKRCAKCGDRKKMLFLRKKKWLWCEVCESKGLQRNLDYFRDLVAAAAETERSV